MFAHGSLCVRMNSHLRLRPYPTPHLQNLQPQHNRSQHQRNHIRRDDGQAADHHTIAQPQRHPRSEQRIHRQRNAGEIARAPRLPSLRHKGDGGEESGNSTETYPLNPNDPPQGFTGMTTADGRFSIMMPTPSACSVPCRTHGIRVSGRRMVHGCACTRMQGSG